MLFRWFDMKGMKIVDRKWHIEHFLKSSLWITEGKFEFSSATQHH
jgi:hypothetical protein